MQLPVRCHNAVTIRRGNVGDLVEPVQRMTLQEVSSGQQGSMDRKPGSQSKASDSSLPFLNTLSLVKTNSHEQRNTVGGLEVKDPSVQSHKTNFKFFGGPGESINPRLSDDNQSGTSVDSASRKKRIVTLNPIE